MATEDDNSDSDDKLQIPYDELFYQFKDLLKEFDALSTIHGKL